MVDRNCGVQMMKPLCLHFSRVLFYQQEAWLNNRSLSREITTWEVCCFFGLSLIFESISHFNQRAMISTGFSLNFNTLCCCSVNKTSHLYSSISGSIYFFSFCHLVVCLSAIILWCFRRCLRPPGLMVKRLKFLCVLKGSQMQTGKHTTAPPPHLPAGGFLFLTFSAVVCLAAALINTSILVLQELNVPGKKKKNYFRQASRKITQNRVEKKQVLSLRMLRKAQSPWKKGEPCFIHAPWQTCQDFCPASLRTANAVPAKRSVATSLSKQCFQAASRQKEKQMERSGS